MEMAPRMPQVRHMMPDGHILCAVSQAPDSSAIDSIFHSLMFFYEFDYTTNAFNQVLCPNGQMSYPQPCFVTIMLNLPDGGILLGIEGSNQYYIYSPGNAPLAAGKPTVAEVTESGCEYMITGALFNGISQGSAYGDDWQNGHQLSNAVRLMLQNGHTYYAPTKFWNRTGIQTGPLSDTAWFTIPANATPLMAIMRFYLAPTVLVPTLSTLHTPTA